MSIIKAKAIVWVGTRTSRLSEMGLFLKEVLGLEMVSQQKGFAEMQLSNGDKVEVFGNDSPHNSHFITGPVAEFLVDDVSVAQAAMEKQGVEFFGPPQSGGGYSWSHFKAPDGNIYGLASGNYSRRAENFSAKKNNYSISTDKSRLDLEVIHAFLSKSYWASNRTVETIKKSLEHSLCFGVYFNEDQVGFARVITDYATFAYLADVFILENHRGKGLSKWLMECIHRQPELQGLRRWILATKDAHELYEKYGYQPLVNPARWMERYDPNA